MPSRNRCPPNAICRHSKRVLSFCFSTTAREKNTKEGKSERKPSTDAYTAGWAILQSREQFQERGSKGLCRSADLPFLSCGGYSTLPRAPPPKAPCQPPGAQSACTQHVHLAHVTVIRTHRAHAGRKLKLRRYTKSVVVTAWAFLK